MKSSSAIRLAALAVVLSSSAALAEWRTYQGGNWNNASSWSPAGIPNEFDLAIFQSAHAGNVYVGGGFDVYEIQIEGGSDGYHFTAETNAIGNVQRITNHGANTIIQIPNLRGLPFQNGYAIAVQSPVDMEIRSSLSDTDGQSLDAYISRTWTRPNFHSGMTYLIGSTFLEDQGNFQASPLIVFDKAPMFVNNMDFETERFNDAAQLQMTAGFLHMDGPVNERVGGVHILQGDTRIALSNGAGMVGAGPGLTRDNTKRGTLMLESDWEAFKVAPNVFGTEIVPYVTHYGNLAQYNPGEDLIPGNTDDVGFLPILGTDLDLALTDEHASVGDDTMFEAQTVRSLQVLSNTTFATGDQQLTLTDGVMVMGDGARITQSIAGTVVLQGPEGIVHVPYGTATVSARLNAVTLTKGGSGILVLDGPNNISGPYVINGGRLHLDSINSINASNELRLVEASLELNMPSTTLPN
ncbi:MAG TPA: hypothetical protein PK402_10095, partial [Tepidisphaeraceae bacterium]|nr:hypothetical protein [Tepidisphaeraceae bacterium]